MWLDYKKMGFRVVRNVRPSQCDAAHAALQPPVARTINRCRHLPAIPQSALPSAPPSALGRR